jgi:sialidase-1
MKQSNDRGQTWRDARQIVDVARGDLNVQAPALLRLSSGEILMVCLRAHRTEVNLGSSSTMACFRSRDNGQTFQEEAPVWQRSRGQWLQGGANALVLLKSGRILLPFHGGTGTQWAQKNTARCYVSDDQGRSWRPTPAAIELPKRGAMEASVAELEDGELVMSLRTQLGGPYICRSRDGGETWSEPVPSGLEGPESCTCLRRIPNTNTLLLIWNHSAYEPNGDHFGKRSPLTVATSKDRGQTWQVLGDLATDPAASYDDIGCYFLSDGSAVVTFRYGLPAWKNLSLHAFLVPSAWYSRP